MQMDAQAAADVPGAPGQRLRPFPDRTPARTAALNQTLFGAVVVVMSILVIAFDFEIDPRIYFAGVVLVFLVTGLALIIPWSRVPAPWLALVPVGDILSIEIMRLSGSITGMALLFIFPTMWLAAGFGIFGLIGGVTLSSVLYGVSSALDPRVEVTLVSFLLPITLAAVAVVSFLTARRAAAQRRLLDRQASLLGQAAERARRQEQLVTEVLDAVDFGVVRIDHDGSTSVTNEAHGTLQHVIRATDGSDAPQPYREDGATPLPLDELPLERARRGEAFEDQRVWFGDPSGPQRALSVTARRLTDVDGEDTGAVIVSRDVTVEMSALRARDEFVSSVSHELRTPLTSILGYIELALDNPGLPDRVRAGLEVADRNADRLLNIVSDVLDARASDDRVELSFQPVDVDVSDVARAAVESLLPRAAERSIAISTAALEPAMAHVDPDRLRQVMDNLLSNAIKYNREGGRIEIQSAVRGRSCVIAVRDTGVGMTEEDLSGVFQRYYRGMAVRGSNVQGTGLGLAISRDIVRSHGGEIGVSSTLGIGSTFTVTLPVARAEARTASPSVREESA